MKLVNEAEVLGRILIKIYISYLQMLSVIVTLSNYLNCKFSLHFMRFQNKIIRGSFYNNQRGATTDHRGGRGGYRNDRGSGRGGPDRGTSISNRGGSRSGNTFHSDGNESQGPHRSSASSDVVRDR